MAVSDLYIGKGIVSFKKEGEAEYRDLGNCPEVEFTPEIETLEHFSSREGVRTKDLTVVLAKSGTVRVVFEELTPENLLIAFLGEENSDGSIEIFASNAVSGALKFTGTNEVGRQFEVIFNKVDFIPSGAIPLISDEFLGVEITGEAAAVNGSFGTVTDITASA
jgi:hypothetical protein